MPLNAPGTGCSVKVMGDEHAGSAGYRLWILSDSDASGIVANHPRSNDRILVVEYRKRTEGLPDARGEPARVGRPQQGHAVAFTAMDGFLYARAVEIRSLKTGR